MPSGNTIQQQLSNGFVEVKDPGASGAIPSSLTGVCSLVSAAAETRTLADPTRVGLDLALCHQTDGGAITLTVATAFNETGNNTITFDDPGEYIRLQSVRVGSSIVWRQVGVSGATPSTV